MDLSETSEYSLIFDDLIKIVEDRLNREKRLHLSLPLQSKLHIERPLPFLSVYRQPPDFADSGTARFIAGEASYLVASGDQPAAPGISALIKKIVTILSEKYGAFLIVEIWSSRSNSVPGQTEPNLEKPVFRIYTGSCSFSETHIHHARQVLSIFYGSHPH